MPCSYYYYFPNNHYMHLQGSRMAKPPQLVLKCFSFDFNNAVIAFFSVKSHMPSALFTTNQQLLLWSLSMDARYATDSASCRVTRMGVPGVEVLCVLLWFGYATSYGPYSKSVWPLSPKLELAFDQAILRRTTLWKSSSNPLFLASIAAEASGRQWP